MVVLAVTLWYISCGVRAADSLQSEEESLIARVLELSGPLGINRVEAEVISLGMWLTESDTLSVPEDGHITLLFRDGSVTRVVGPATITPTSVPDKRGDNVLAKLSSALSSLLFSPQVDLPDAIAGCRISMDTSALGSELVWSAYPPTDCRLLSPPRQLKWGSIEKAASYAVSLFDVNQVIWRTETAEAGVELPASPRLIQLGNAYWWEVAAKAGDSILGFQRAVFYVLGESEIERLNRYLAEVDIAVTDQRLSHLLKASVFTSLGLKLECCREIQSTLKAFPDDYSALAIKTESCVGIEVFK